MRIAIIGAGLSGLATAYHLVNHCEVVIFDSKGIGGGASGIATGLMHPYTGEQCRRSLHATEGMQATRELLQATGSKFSTGILRLVQEDEQYEMFLSHVEKFGDVRLHGPRSFFIESGLTIDCSSYLEGLWQAIQAKGGKLICEEIQELKALADFDHIVVAAGAGIKRFPELNSLKTYLLKGQVLKCRGMKLPSSSMICKGYIALSSEPGICHIGSTYDRDNITEVPDSAKAQGDLFPKVGAFFPDVHALEVLECRAALRVMRKGHYFPIAQRVKDNVWALTALGSRGLLYHAYLGKLLAQAVLAGDEGSLVDCTTKCNKAVLY